VRYDKGVVAEVINKFFPDFRRVLNELQRYAATGSIDSGILSTFNNSAFDSLIEMIGDKNFTEVRKWVAENAQGDIDSIFEAFYNNCSKYFEPKSIPELVLILAKYQYQTAFVSNQEINLSACMVDIMANCLVKK
jgi:replication factor C small subunit